MEQYIIFQKKVIKTYLKLSIKFKLISNKYLYNLGNDQGVMCERGIVVPHTHEPTARFIADIQVIPAIRKYSHLPIVVDPSHATFNREFVPSISKAGIAAGADGLILEVDPKPQEAAVDPIQALSYEVFDELMSKLRDLAPIVGKTL